MSSAIYTRQSIDKKDSVSIEGQIEFCKKELAENETYKVYPDKGYSGKNTNRPSFEKLIKDIENGNINRVIVYKLDRISRSTLDFANIINIFKKYDVEFISSTEKFDTSTPIGKAMLQIVMVFAELERETIQKRITDNYYFRGKMGHFLGGRCPLGFSKTKIEINGKKTSMFIEDQERSLQIIEMYDLYANTNMSLGEISASFNKKGILSADSKKWDSSKISRMLKSPLYVKADADIYMYYKNKGCIFTNEVIDFTGTNGCYLFGKRPTNERKYTNVEGHILTIAPHKGFIDSKTWLLCQYKLDSNKQIKNSGKGKHSWLSGLAKCGYCKYAVSVVIVNGKYKYFMCRGKVNLKICNGHSRTIYVEEIELEIKEKLIAYIKNLKQRNNSHIVPKDNLQSNKLKLEIIEIDKQIENLINQIAEGNEVVIKYINEKISNLDQKKYMLIEKMKENTIISKDDINTEDILNKTSNWDKLTLEDKKYISRLFIDKIFIFDNKIEIIWKVKKI